jgi:hypothetical protein
MKRSGFQQWRALFTVGVTYLAVISFQTTASGNAKGSIAPKQPAAPAKPKIAEIPKAVREEIERLISDDSAKRATAAASLAEMGPAAAPAIPYLAAALDDFRSVLSLRRGNVEVRTIVLDTLRPFREPATKEILSRLSPPENANNGANLGCIRT